MKWFRINKKKRMADWEESLRKNYGDKYPDFEFIVYDNPGEVHPYCPFGFDVVKKDKKIEINLYENFEPFDSMARTTLYEEIENEIKRESAVAFVSYWISPDRREFEIPSEMTHYEWVFENLPLLSKYGIERKDLEDKDEEGIKKVLFDKGFIRIVMEYNEMSIEARSISDIKSYAEDFIYAHLPIKEIYIDTMDGRSFFISGEKFKEEGWEAIEKLGNFLQFKRRAFYPSHPKKKVIPKNIWCPGYTEHEIWSYYHLIKSKMLSHLIGRYLLFILSGEKPGKVIIRRHDLKTGRFWLIKDEKDFDRLNNGRLLTIFQHSEYPDTPKKTDEIRIDIDPNDAVPWKERNRICLEILKVIKKLPFFEDFIINYSGRAGFHIRAKTKDRITEKNFKEEIKRLKGEIKFPKEVPSLPK